LISLLFLQVAFSSSSSSASFLLEYITCGLNVSYLNTQQRRGKKKDNMNENEEFTHVQRRLCAVIAKSEWTSSRMRMQKSGEELRESRAKSHRTANQFLQNLLEKRTDSDLIDDNGAVDRYHKFLKYKSAFNDDQNSTLDEFDRRLRALNTNRRNQTTKVNHSNFNTINEKKQHQHVKHDLQPTIDKKDQVCK